MNALILSAGQGKRLLPLTASTPKCLLPLQGKSVIQWQIEALAACGVGRVSVVVGFGADKVKAELERWCAPSFEVVAVDNPHFAVSDNLVSCWIARREMESDFVLLNGDTLFEQRVLQRLLDSAQAPVMMTISRKASYDADDMKVRCDDSKLLAVGKDLPLTETTGESIGMLRFCGDGPALFRDALDAAMRQEGASRRWYLSVVDGLAKRGLVSTVSVEDLQWAEIDFPQDLEKASELVGNWSPIRPAAGLSA